MQTATARGLRLAFCSVVLSLVGMSTSARAQQLSEGQWTAPITGTVVDRGKVTLEGWLVRTDRKPALFHKKNDGTWNPGYDNFTIATRSIAQGITPHYYWSYSLDVGPANRDFYFPGPTQAGNQRVNVREYKIVAGGAPLPNNGSQSVQLFVRCGRLGQECCAHDKSPCDSTSNKCGAGSICEQQPSTVPPPSKPSTPTKPSTLPAHWWNIVCQCGDALTGATGVWTTRYCFEDTTQSLPGACTQAVALPLGGPGRYGCTPIFNESARTSSTCTFGKDHFGVPARIR